eukprot:TRINITY_DN4991_c0_g1_i1.p1 TRINITY_DN4991_c0_g1~~TRINITY_DN4991_c0_g1_i1.p1  ORF type:complete len:404 (-),score=123.73 TRINITY_DN4991_c0_g1_i1:63-1145(-)
MFSRGLLLPEQGTWHIERKKAILKAHPEVKELYGHNIWSFVLMLFCTSSLTALSIYVRDWSWGPYVLAAYTLGALLSFQCQVLGHEGTHRLVSPHPIVNKAQAIFAFLPVFMGPFGMWWAFEHMWHHNVVVDKCLRYGRQNNAPIKKALFTLLFQPIVDIAIAVSACLVLVSVVLHMPLYFAGLRSTMYPTTSPFPPYNKFPQAIGHHFLINMAFVAVYRYFIYTNWGASPLLFLFLSAGFMNGLHPLGMRQVQEHYFSVKGQPTNSCYTPFHLLALNICYHVEHHDFPAIPWNRLPRLRELAPEYYNNLFAWKSYTEVLVEFLSNPGITVEDVFNESPLGADGGSSFAATPSRADKKTK